MTTPPRCSSRWAYSPSARWTGPQAGGGIASLVGLLFVLPGIVAPLPASTADAINTYLPLNAGFAVATSTFENSHHLAPWAGISGYAVLAVAATAGRRSRALQAGAVGDLKLVVPNDCENGHDPCGTGDRIR